MLRQRARHDARAPHETTDYASAVAHYTSPRRRDAVKRHWEEPLLRRLLDRALAAVDADGDRPLRVLDVGCGSGAGLRLLDATSHARRRTAPLSYVGLDVDPALLAVARTQHAADPRATFVQGDVRDAPPVADVDLCLSTGVPYSHLSADELEAALAGLLATARDRSRPTALVVDVLGRYSVEWTRRWDRARWPYRMSFFEGDAPPPSAPMSTYAGDELRALIARAATRADCAAQVLCSADRSILVGRHSVTGEYADGFPAFRTLVNRLWDPAAVVDPGELRFVPPEVGAPDAVLDFYAVFAAAWNDLVTGSAADDATGQITLAERLRQLEADLQQGLGVGHSLTAVVVTRPRA